MQRRDSGKTAWAGYVGRYVPCGLALAIVAGCGGANHSSSAAAQSVTDPAQTSAPSGSNTSSSATSSTPSTHGQAPGSAFLSWSAPAANTDGSTLVNLAGYKIDYGTSAGSLTQSVTISDPTTTSYTLQGLAAGTWYFTVSDFTSVGVVSAFSSVVSKTIQ